MPSKNLTYSKRPLHKALLRSALMTKPINLIVVKFISMLGPSNWRKRVPVIDAVGILDLDSFGSIRLGRTDRCQVAMDLYWNNGRLASRADQYALDAAITLGKSAKLFLDIGSYTGLFATAVAKANPKIRSYAYEIIPENFLIIYENIFLNDLTLQIEPRLCGVANAAGSLKVPSTLGLGVLGSSIALNWTFDSGVKIPIRTLDELHSGHDGPGVIKIDVEGFEAEVLEGGSNLMKNTKPDIICEILTRAPRIPYIENMLDDLGYNRYHITDIGYIKKDRIIPEKHQRDWLFSTKSCRQLSEIGIIDIINTHSK